MLRAAIGFELTKLARKHPDEDGMIVAAAHGIMSILWTWCRRFAVTLHIASAHTPPRQVDWQGEGVTDG